MTSLFTGVAGFPVDWFEVLVLKVSLVVRRAVAQVRFRFSVSSWVEPDSLLKRSGNRKRMTEIGFHHQRIQSNLRPI